MAMIYFENRKQEVRKKMERRVNTFFFLKTEKLLKERLEEHNKGRETREEWDNNRKTRRKIKKEREREEMCNKWTAFNINFITIYFNLKLSRSFNNERKINTDFCCPVFYQSSFSYYIHFFYL